MPKNDIFPEKRMEAILFMFWNIMLTLVSLDKMQNFSTLMRKRSKSEGRALKKLLTSEAGLSPPEKYFY